MTILEDLKSGRLVVVPPVRVKPLAWQNYGGHGDHIISAHSLGITWRLDTNHLPWAEVEEFMSKSQADYEARILSAITASPDHTTALLSLVEGMEREAGWEPIDTAPKDGTPFEALYEDGTTEDEVYWSEQRYCILGAPQGSKGPGCMSSEAGLPVDPTHWRRAALASQREIKEAQGYAQLAAAGWEQETVRANAAEARALAAEAKVEALREALARQSDNMAFVVNNVGLPDQWREKFDRELAEDRRALTQEKNNV